MRVMSPPTRVIPIEQVPSTKCLSSGNDCQLNENGNGGSVEVVHECHG
jgi:hypothetical protein